MGTTKNAPALPSVEMVKPSEVVIGANIRLDAALSPEFVESVATHGVVVPVMAYRDQSGTVVVIDGQRRTLAAVEAKAESMPALIGASVEDAERITRQWIANESRAAMSSGDRFEAVRQMALIGLTADQIAQQMPGISREDAQAVTAAEKAGVTRETVNALPTLSLTDHAIRAEFADNPDALAFFGRDTGEALEQSVKQWRIKQRRAAMLAEAEAEWKAKGATLGRSSYDDRRPTPEQLTTRAGKPLPEDLDTLAQMPGVVLILSASTRSVRNGDTVEVEDYVRTEVRVNDAARNGYMRRVAEGNKLLDAEQAKARRRAEREAKEQWATDQQARREHIADLLTAKTAPTGAESIAALWMVGGRSRPLAEIAPLFGADAAKIATEAQRPRTTARRLTIAAVIALMQWEAGVSNGTAHHPRAIDRAMFDALAHTGYSPTASDRSIGTPKPRKTKATKGK